MYNTYSLYYTHSPWTHTHLKRQETRKNNIKEWSCHVMHGYYRALRPPPTSCYMAFSIDCIEHCIVIWLLLVLLLHVCTYMHGLHEKMHGTRLYKRNGGIISDGGGGVVCWVAFPSNLVHCWWCYFVAARKEEEDGSRCTALHSLLLVCISYCIPFSCFVVLIIISLSLRGTWEEEAPKSQRINRATQ